MVNLIEYNLTDRAIELYKQLTNNNTDFSEGRLIAWLKEKNVAFKDNPTAWFIKVFPTELKKGAFSRIEYIPASQPLFNTMREKGIVVRQQDCIYIDLLLERIAKVKTQKTIESWLEDTIDYLIKKVEKPTSEHLIAVFKKSKAVSAIGIDWEELEKEYQEEQTNYEATMLAINMEGR